MVKNCRTLAGIIVLTVIFMTGKAFSETPVYRLSIISESEAGMALYLRLDQEISLDELVCRAGYEIDPEDLTPFLTDFSLLNETATNLAQLEEGTVIKLPLKYLRKIDELQSQQETAEQQAVAKTEEPKP